MKSKNIDDKVKNCEGKFALKVPRTKKWYCPIINVEDSNVKCAYLGSKEVVDTNYGLHSKLKLVYRCLHEEGD